MTVELIDLNLLSINRSGLSFDEKTLRSFDLKGHDIIQF